MLNDTINHILGNLPWAKGTEAEEDGLTETTVNDESSEDIELWPSTMSTVSLDLTDEHALIAAARDGDEIAFQALMDAHHAAVFGLACRMVRDQDEAAEITQDVFLAAWRGLASFREDARLSTWLYRITYRRCLQSIEAQQHRFNALSQFASTHMERLANAWSAMQASLAEQEWCQAIQEQLDALPAKYQVVLTLRHWHDLSYEEISQHLTLPISTVKTHLFRARALLRERLEAIELPHVQLPQVQLPQVQLPQVQLPQVQLPQVQLPQIGPALRDRWDRLVENANEFGALLQGHISTDSI